MNQYIVASVGQDRANRCQVANQYYDNTLMELKKAKMCKLDDSLKKSKMEDETKKNRLIS